MRLTGLVALFCALTSAASSPPEPAPPAGPKPLRVITYNILAGDRGLKGIADTLKTANADLIALQEVDRVTRRSGKVDQAAKLGAALGMHHAFAPHFDYQGGEFGNALLSRFPIVRAERVRVKGSRLSLLDAIVKTPSGEIHVVVVHFTVTFPFRDSKDQAATDKARLLEAKAALALVKGDKRPSLVLGDMNDDTSSPTYEVFEPTLQDACHVKGNGIAKTWNSAFPITRIDYIWASSAYDVQSCDTLSSSASDHLPVSATLSPRK